MQANEEQRTTLIEEQKSTPVVENQLTPLIFRAVNQYLDINIIQRPYSSRSVTYYINSEATVLQYISRDRTDQVFR